MGTSRYCPKLAGMSGTWPVRPVFFKVQNRGGYTYQFAYRYGIFRPYWPVRYGIDSLGFNGRGLCGAIQKIYRSLRGARYDGQYLHKVVKEKLGETRLHSTLTNVVIPIFDIRHLQPTIFSSYEVYLSPFLFNYPKSSYLSAPCHEV